MSTTEELKVEDVSTLDLPVGKRTGETHEGLSVLEDVGHPLVPSVSHDYIKRQQQDNTTDLSNIGVTIEDPDFSTLIVGETGAGKDYSVLTHAANTNRPLVRTNFGVGTTYEQLVGMFQPKEGADEELVERVNALIEQQGVSREVAVQLIAGASTQFEWVDGLLTWAAKYGAVFDAAEINAAGGEATMPLHGITEQEGERYLSIPEAGVVYTDLPVTDEEVAAAAEKHDLDPANERSEAEHMARVDKWDDDEHLGDYIHPEFKFVATMNPPKYSGAKELNSAFKQRFFTVEMTYLPKEGEKAMLFGATHFDSNDETDARAVEKLTDIGEKLRESYRAMDIASPVGHRLMIQVAKLSKEQMSPKGAAKYVFGNNAIEEDKAKINKLIDTTKFE